MERTVERSNAPVGYTWTESEGEYYLRNENDELKRVSENALKLLREIAAGNIERSELDGGARNLYETLESEGYARPSSSVVRLERPDDIRFLPRLAAFLVLVAGCGVAARHVDGAVGPMVASLNGLELVGLAGILVASMAVHEFGHYTVADRHFDPTIRLGRLNGVLPAVITDTTNAWLLPRNRRLWINLAGPFAHAVFAIGLFAVYHFVLPGSELFAVAAIITATTMALSINPLVHGDGYCLLVDAFGVVDLRTRGVEDLRNLRPSLAAGYAVLSYGFGASIAAMWVLWLATSF